MKSRNWKRLGGLATAGILLTILTGCGRFTLPGGDSAETTAEQASEAGGQQAKPGGQQSKAGNQSGAERWTGGSSTQQQAAGQRAARPATPPPPRKITLPAGTVLTVRTTNEISTKVVKAGDPFVATLAEPLMDGMTLIAPKGARVEGMVAAADKGGRVKGRASLSVRLNKLTTDIGGTVPIQTSIVSIQAKSSKKKDAVKVGIASGIGAVIGAIAGGGKGAAIGAGAGAGAGGGLVLATRGKAAVLPAESLLKFELAAPVTITEKR